MTRRVFLVLLLVLFAPGCDEDSSPPDGGTTDAGVIDPDSGTDASTDGGVAELSWASCGEGRVECATMEVPVDYDAPDGATMTLALLRWPALSPADRIGVLLYGPGGPGTSGVDGARGLPGRMVPVMGEIVRRFDIVGMDLRGTGASTPWIDCIDDAARMSMLSDLENAADDAAADALVTAAIDGCRTALGADALSHFDTVSNARDIDRLREMLGEEQLSILGESYGTWVATVYAAQNPTRVRAAVLASAISASNDTFDRIENRVRGTELALGAFFDWCDANTSCAFYPATGTTREAFDALATQIIAAPIGMLDLATFRNVVLRTLYAPSYDAMAIMLEAARTGNPTPFLGASATIYADTRGYADALIVVGSLDETLAPGATIDDWRTRLTTLRADAPSFGALMTDRDPQVRFSLAWTDPPDEPFSVAAIPDVPPFLMLANDFDPVTPIAGATTLATALGNGTVILDTQNLGHNSLSRPCALSHARDYLLDPSSLTGSPAMIACPEVAPDETIIGTVSAAYTWTRTGAREGETDLGDLVTDAMRASAGAQIAAINGGGIRKGLPADTVLPSALTLRRPEAGYAAGPPFDLIVDDARAMLPFGNRIATISVTGAELWSFLEWAVSTYDGVAPQDEFVQVSGVRLSFDPSAASGSRIQTLTLDDASPIANDATTTYTLAVVDYVLYGGTGYLEFLESEPSIGETLDDALIAYLRANSLGTPPMDLTPSTDGRISPL